MSFCQAVTNLSRYLKTAYSPCTGSTLEPPSISPFQPSNLYSIFCKKEMLSQETSRQHFFRTPTLIFGRWPLCAYSTSNSSDSMSRPIETNRSIPSRFDEMNPARDDLQSAKALSKTLNLPKTTFPMRADATKREMSLLKDHIYNWQEKTRLDAEVFVLHDGPPYANGSPHLGHALNKILKDVINRYKILQGYRVSYIPGWDCHGLPIEQKVMSSLSQEQRRTLSPIMIRNQAYQYAFEQIHLQREHYQRWGVLGKWEQPYLTLNPKYEADQLLVFWKMLQKNLIYRALRPIFWSPSSQTALAEAELEYVDNHISQSVYSILKVTSWSSQIQTRLDDLVSKPLNHEAYLLNPNFQSFPTSSGIIIWTTTPWTLPANVTVCVGAGIDYTLVRDSMRQVDFLVAESRISPLEQKLGRQLQRLLTNIRGDIVAGTSYAHPFEPNKTAMIVIGEHVTDSEGTGLVHTAPGHGMEDFLLCKRLSLVDNIFSPVDNLGRFTDEVGPKLAGKFVLDDGNEAVIQILQDQGLVYLREPYAHRYPYDWRTKKPIIIRATKQWFADLKTISRKSIDALQDVEIDPATGRKRLVFMLQNRQEWCISRQRSWGVPIPVFYDRNTGAPWITEESINHFVQLVRTHGTNCWWEMDISELIPPSLGDCEHAKLASCSLNLDRDQLHSDANPDLKNSKFQYSIEKLDCEASLNLVKSMDTMDVWFDSGTSWSHVLKSHYPANLYFEGSDQHRGWFQSSLLTSIAIHGRAPFKQLLTHGFILDENGQKMSKSLGNVIDPSWIVQGCPSDPVGWPAYGADTLRLLVASLDYRSDVNISKELIKTTAMNLKKIRNTVRFMLANLDNFVQRDATSNRRERLKHLPIEELPELDQYMLHNLCTLIERCTQRYEEFAFYSVVRELLHYATTDLSAFYFNIIKDRLYAEEAEGPRRRAAQTVLSHILEAFTKLLAPLLCYTAEEIYQHLPWKMLPQEKKLMDKKAQKSHLGQKLDNNGDVSNLIMSSFGHFNASCEDDPSLDSIFLSKWPKCPQEWKDESLGKKWEHLLHIRSTVYRAIEYLRQSDSCHFKSSSETDIVIYLEQEHFMHRCNLEDLVELFLVATCIIKAIPTLPSNVLDQIPFFDSSNNSKMCHISLQRIQTKEEDSQDYYILPLQRFEPEKKTNGHLLIQVFKARGHKCIRCWRYICQQPSTTCMRCSQVLAKTTI